MNRGISNVNRDVNAYDCARGCTDTVRESAMTVTCGRKLPCRTGESNLRRQRVGPMLYQLSYIPTHMESFSLYSQVRLNVPGQGSDLFNDCFGLLLRVVLNKRFHCTSKWLSREKSKSKFQFWIFCLSFLYRKICHNLARQ